MAIDHALDSLHCRQAIVARAASGFPARIVPRAKAVVGLCRGFGDGTCSGMLRVQGGPNVRESCPGKTKKIRVFIHLEQLKTKRIALMARGRLC
jgi:hypothetical protein